MMRIRCLVTLVFSIAVFLGSGQKYTTAAGVRLGTGIGLSIQQSIGGKRTIEGIIQKGFFNDLTTITALLEQHHRIISKATNFYIGAGPHVGLYPSATEGKEDYRKNAYGVTFIGGLEMHFNKLLVSFDYKPAVNITGGASFFDSQAALSFRYILLKPAKKEQKWKFWKKKTGSGNRNDE